MEKRIPLGLFDAEDAGTSQSSPKSLPDFQRVFPDDQACLTYLCADRFPEFVFRFNRRFWPMVAFDSMLKIAACTEAPTYSELYQRTK